MILLGLHKDPWHNSGAAMIRDDGDGPRFVNLSEERLDRVKDSRAWPERSIRACMDELGVSSLAEVDAVVLDYIRSKDWRTDHYRRPCRTDVPLADLPADRVHVVNHHLSHAHAVFYSSPFRHAAILVVDGRGSEQETQTLWLGTPEGIRLLERTTTIGVGLLYAAVTHLIGFGLLQEGKTMGLAPYGAAGRGRLLDLPRDFRGIVTDYSAVCVEDSYAMKKVRAVPETFEEKAQAAYEVQQACEDAMLHLAEHARRITGAENLCISGGVGLNSVANNRVLRSGIFKDVFINPAASDTGIALGAALWGYHHLHGRPKGEGELSAFLGPTYGRERVDVAARGAPGCDLHEDDVQGRVAALLARNRIVAVSHGRSEMGPRALGNRSILMSPLRAENKDVLNLRVKHREAFRPFAPAALEEVASDWFVIDRPSPYMLFVPEVRPEKRATIPAVTHVDGTGRLQTLTASRNGRFYDLVRRFGEETGVPVLLNTSFNVAGEPIVETPEDAVRCFLGTDIDALLLEDRLLVKRNGAARP